MAFLCACGVPVSALGNRGKDAEITRVSGSVECIVGNSEPIPASSSNRIPEGGMIRTGENSWAELRFENDGVARIGPHSSFTFKNGSRRMSLKEGSAVVELPKGAHGARIEGDQNIAVVAGATALFECHPNVFKFLVLDGTVRFFRPGHLGDSILLPPGRMVIGQPGTALSDPVDFDIARFVKTSRFITDFQPLESASHIAQAAQKQDREKAKGVLRSTNLAIFGGGTSVSVLDPAQAPSPGASATVAPPPPQSRDAAAPPVDRIPPSR